MSDRRGYEQFHTRHRRISGGKITFLVTERDIESPFRAVGALIFEQFTNRTPGAVMEQANALRNSGRYGRIWIGQIEEADLVPMEDFKVEEDF
jgi:hypothetical protein